MDDFELQDFNKRIGINTKLDNISKEICNIYKLGDFISNDLITIGYEDYNYVLTTSKGRYCVKIFNKERNKFKKCMITLKNIHKQQKIFLKILKK